MGGRLIRGSSASRQTIHTPSFSGVEIPATVPRMADFINIVHEDLTNQLGRVPRAAFPAFAERGWTIASDPDEGPSGRSKYVDKARQDQAEEVAELTKQAAESASAAASEVEAAAIKTAAEVAAEVAESEPKPKPKTKKEGKT